MSVVINESGLTFGSYGKEALFHVEASEIRKSLNLRTVEFVLRHKNDEILLIEAKSSSPRPGNQADFDEFICEISEKFIHTVDLYFSLVLKRVNDTAGDMPDFFKKADYAAVKITLLLIINGHKINWLPPIKDAIKLQIKRHIKTWRLDVAVMNNEQAGSYGLLYTNGAEIYRHNGAR